MCVNISSLQTKVYVLENVT